MGGGQEVMVDVKALKRENFGTAYRGQLSTRALKRMMSRGGLNESVCHGLCESLLLFLQNANDRFP
jgi:hypothetical protein